MAEAFLGEIRMVGFNYAPPGWVFCEGQMMPIQQNSALFALLGTTYGGGLPVEIRDPYVGMNFIIALQGIFPSRS